MEPPNRMFYWTFYTVSNRYREPSKRILLAVILEKVQHFSWKVQHAFVTAKRSPLYRVYIHALSVHTKSLFLRHFTRIGWDEGGGAVQCSPPPLRPQPSLVSCFLITMQPGQWSVSGLYCIMGDWREETAALLTSWKLTSVPCSASRHPLMVQPLWPLWPDSTHQGIVTDSL